VKKRAEEMKCFLGWIQDESESFDSVLVGESLESTILNYYGRRIS